jgi:drug/metabolite transporter (DMT)-like permease
MNRSVSVQAIVLLIVLSLMWGSSFILIKKGLEAFSPAQVGALRVAAASVFLLPIGMTRFKNLGRRHLWMLMTSGLMGIFIPAFLFAAAQTKIPSSLAGILNTLTPAFTLIIGALFFHQRFRWISVAGLILAFAGTLMLMIARENGRIEGIQFHALLIVAACVLYGSNLNFVKFKITDLSPMTITSGALMMIGPMALGYLFAFTPFISTLQHVPGAWRSMAYVVLLGMMSTALATYLFYRLIRISTPLLASSVTYFMPIVAVMWGVADGEKLYPGHFIGMAAILTGVYLANRNR